MYCHPTGTGKSVGVSNFRLWCESLLHPRFPLRNNLHGGQSPKPCAILPFQRTRDGGGVIYIFLPAHESARLCITLFPRGVYARLRPASKVEVSDIIRGSRDNNSREGQ